MIGNESWLNPNIYSGEVFPSEYNAFRKDRSDCYGGVIIACHNKLTSFQLTLDDNSSSELIVIQLQQITHQLLSVQSIAHPNPTALSLLTYVHLLVK